MVATKSGLDSLRLLAIREFKAHAENLNIFEIFDAIKADFKDLASLESDGWIHGFLHKKIQEAFEHDHRVFKNEALLETLDNAVLGKVVMRWVVEMYDENMSRMILEEKEARVIMEKRMEILESGAIECATSGQELVPPVVDECRAQEASEHGSVHTEGFHTISCPSEEIGGSEDCVLVDGDDLSGPVEQANDGWEDADLLTAEAVSAEPEAVPVEEEPVPRRKLSKKEKTRKMAEAKEQEDSRRKEEEVRSQLELHDEEQARVREEEEAKVREQQEAATAATAAAEIEPVTIAEEAVNDALPVRKASKKKRMLGMEEARLKEEAEAVAAAAATAAAELESVNAEREWKLRKKMKVAAKKKKREEATELLRQEAEAGAESLRQEAKRREEEAAEAERVLAEEEEARLREEEEEAAAAAAAAASLKAEPVTDAEPRVCPSRAKHMINEKEWMECASCRAAMQHMAVRLSRTNVDEGTLQDLEKELVI
jgi:DNA segregation ATPase FtsK/SpoIIIE-like protein